MSTAMPLDFEEILSWLHEEDDTELEKLWRRADRLRRENVGDAIYLRGLIEFSSHCARHCAYCGLNASNAGVSRYRMSAGEVLQCTRLAVERGFGTVVLQSGEDPRNTPEWVSELVRRIKGEAGLAVTLSLGEQRIDTLKRWREAGADRYLLRFETSNRALFERVHPPLASTPVDRIAMLQDLRSLGYEVGSGTLVGIYGQSYADLACDIVLCRDLDLDMIGLGPYISHPATPMGQEPSAFRLSAGEQVPATELMTYKALALARIACPRANIPTTTALTTLNRERSIELGFTRGANIFMPNLTPRVYRGKYAIYPSKRSLVDRDEESLNLFRERIEAIGRTIGAGRGNSVNWVGREGGSSGVR